MDQEKVINPIKRKAQNSMGIICELARLKCQESYLQNVHSKGMLDIPLEENDIEEKRLLAEIQLEIEKLNDGFTKEKQEAKFNIENLDEMIVNLQEMAKDINQYHVKDYRETILKIENRFGDLYNMNRLRLGQLKCENFDIASDIPNPAVLLREEKAPAIFHQLSSDIHSKNMIQESQYAEVKAFDDFLVKTGGHTGGWNDEEHSIFLGLKAKYHSNLRRIEECLRQVLPGITEEDVQKHDEWFKKYTVLKNSRKKAIEKWKSQKKPNENNKLD